MDQPGRGPDRRSYRVSFERFRRLAPDHQPRYGLVETVAELAEGLQRMGFDDADFRKSKFMRLNVLSDLRDRGLLDGDLAWNADRGRRGLPGMTARSEPLPRLRRRTRRRPFSTSASTPLANSYLRAEDLLRAEPFYPLQVSVCRECFLVQVPAVQTPEEIFGDYAYFSSFSTAWLKHVEEYAERMIRRARARLREPRRRDREQRRLSAAVLQAARDPGARHRARPKRRRGRAGGRAFRR